jgi:hypothetical protein
MGRRIIRRYIRESLWNEDAAIIEKAHNDFYAYMDDIMSTTYSSNLDFNHKCTPTSTTCTEVDSVHDFSTQGK